MNKTLKHGMGTKALSFLLAFIMTFSTLAVGITPMMDIFAGAYDTSYTKVHTYEYYCPAGTTFITYLAIYWSSSNLQDAINNITNSTNKYTSAGTDLNYGLDQGKNDKYKYICLGYKRSNNIGDSIRDLVIYKGGAGTATLKFGNVDYVAVGQRNALTNGQYITDTATCDGTASLNQKGSGSYGGTDLHYYATKLPAGGSPITDIVVDLNANLDGYETINYSDGTGPANANLGAGGNEVYTHVKRLEAVDTAALRAALTAAAKLLNAGDTDSTLLSAYNTANTIRAQFDEKSGTVNGYSADYNQAAVDMAADALTRAIDTRTLKPINDISESHITFYVPETIYLNPSDFKSFQYFVDCDSSGTTRTGANTTGNIYFKCNNSNAKIQSISCDNANVTYNTVVSTNSNTYSTTITGALKTAISEKQNTTLTWTVTYKIGDLTYTAKSYTVCYATFKGSSAAGGYGRSTKHILEWAHDTMSITATTWLSGIHDVIGGSYAYKFAPFTGNSGCAGSGTGNITISGSGMAVKSEDSSNSSKNLSVTGGIATLYVDTSRYTNFNQIPNLRVGLDINSCEENNGTSENYLTFDGHDLYRQTIKVSAGRLCDSATLANGINGSVGTTRVIYVIGRGAVYKSRRTDSVTGTLPVLLLCINKSSLRSLYRDAVNSGRQSSWYKSGWTEYETALKAAAESLGTLTSINASTVNLAKAICNLELYKTNITLSKQSGTGGTSSVTAFRSVPMPTITVPTRTGYNFDGYFDAASGGNKYYNSNGTSAKAWDKTDASATLYAHWTPIQYSVTYANGAADNGIIPSSASLPGYATNAFNIEGAYTLTNASAPGYTFNGWTLSGATFPSGANVTKVTSIPSGTYGDVTATANWTPITYTVTYNDNNNASGSTAASTHTYDVSKALTANGFTRVYTVTYKYMDATETGAATSTSTYNFDGWATSSGGAVAYTNGQNVTNLASTQGASVPLYAKWKDGGITLPTPKRTGYVFKGWYTQQYGAGTKVGDGGATYYPTSNITIYANWAKMNYTLTVNPNGGTYKGSTNPTDENIAYYDKVNLENPVREGYMFAGWDRTFEIVNDRTEDTNDPVLDLNKKYPASGYTTHFSGGSGITSTDGQEATGEKYTHYKMVQSSASSADTYRHIYFNTNYNIAAGDTVNIKMFIRKTASSQTNWNLYNGNTSNDYGHSVAILSAGAGNLGEWKEISFSRTFSSSDTLGEVGYVELCSGNIKGMSGTISEFDIKEVTTTITHADGTTTVLPSEFYMPARHVTLTAKWREFYYTIKFNANGGTGGPMSDKSLKFAEEWNLAANAFTKKGYYFNGWNPNADLSGQTTYTDKQQISGLSTVDKGVVNLYAIWAKNPYTVKFLGNGATGGTGVQSESGAYYYTQPFSYDTAQNLYNNKFERKYTVTYNYDNATGGKDTENDTAAYTFTGWKTASGAANEDGKSAYSQGESVNNLTSTKNATVSLNAQWSTGSVTLPSPTKTGYTFEGWFDEEIGGNRVGGAGDSYTPSAGITLYAHWTPIRYSVEFNGNGATGGSTAAISNIAYDSSVNLANGFTRVYTVTYNYNGATGNNAKNSDPATFTFKNWNTAANGTGTSYEATNAVHNVRSTAGTTTLYAQWTPALITLPTPTKTGYTFKGWYTDSKLQNAVVLDGSGKYAPTATITLYAKWEANVYNIAFNANNGSGSMDSIQKTCYTDTNLPLNNNRITRIGYIFSGWNTAANGSGTAFADGAAVTTDLSYTNGATVTLYAQWTAITYTVAYNGNGYTGGSTASSTHTYDVAKALTANDFKREYTVKFNGNGADGGDSLADKTAKYSFTGWAESSTGAKKYDNKESVTNLASTQGATVTLYAKWSAASVALPTPTKTGYTFGGWYDSSENKIGDAGAAYTPTANITLHAKWLVNSYTIKFDANTGSGTMASMPKTCYTDASLTANAFTKTGYEFIGWNTEKDGKGIAFADKATVHNDLTYVNAATVTLYAQWKAITYTVNYNGNGNTDGSTAASSHTYDAAKSLTANGFTREYTVKFNGNGADGGDSLADKTAKYSFTGWAENADGAKKYDDKASVTNLASTQGASVPLYAKWASGSVTLPTPTKTGYAFDGWYTSSTFEDGTKVEGSYTPSANITLHARWITRVQDITFDEQFDIAKFSSALTKGTVSEASVNGDTVTIKTTAGQMTNADSYKIPVEELQEYIFSYSQYSPNLEGDNYNLQGWITFWDENGNPVQINSTGSKAYTENELEHFYPNNKTDLANNQNLTADEIKDITFICYYADGDWYQWTPTKWAASRFNGKDSICSGMWNVDVGTHSGTGVYGGTRIYFRAPKGAKYVSVNFGAEVAMTANFKDISLKRVEHYTLPDQITGESYKSTDNFTFNPQTDSFYHPDYDGFTFDKWTIGSGTTQFTNSTDLTQYKSGISLKSNWHENKYRIEFIGNGSNGGSTPAKENVRYSEEVTLTNGFTRGYNVTYKNYNEAGDTTDVAGYSFVGWTDAGGKTYSNNAKVSKLAAKYKDNDEIKLTAQWTYASLTLPTPTKAGYIFAGWYSDSSFTSYIGFGGDSYTATGAVTLHAKWVPAVLDVTYDEGFDITEFGKAAAKDGAAGTNNSISVSGNEIVITSNKKNTISDVDYRIPVAAGEQYLFKAYQKCSEDGSYMTPYITFYDENDNPVNFKKGDGYCFTEEDFDRYINIVNGKKLNNIYEKDGNNWYTNTLFLNEGGNKILFPVIWHYYNGGNKFYHFYEYSAAKDINYLREKSEVSAGNNTTFIGFGNLDDLYITADREYGDISARIIAPEGAVYARVEFGARGAAADKEVTTYFKDISFARVNPYSLPEQVAGGAFTGAAYRSVDNYNITPPARDGFTFNYWKNTATGEEFDPDTLNDYPNGVTLESVWTEHTYTVHFDGNGNTNTGASMADITGKKYTETFNLPYNTLPDDNFVFEKTGWYFAGWSADPNAKVDDEGVYSEGELVSKLAAKVNNPDEITLYAVWSRIRYTIRYYSEPGELKYTQEREYGDEKSLENNFFSSKKVYFIYGDEGPDVEEKYKCTGEHPESKDVSYRIKGWARTYNGDVAYAGDFKGDLTDADGKLLKHNSTIDLYPSWDNGLEFVLPNPEREGLDLVGWYTIGDWEKIQEDQQYQELLYLWNLIAETGKYPAFVKDAMPADWDTTNPAIPEDFILEEEIDVQSQYYVGKGGERVTIDNPGTLYAVWMDTTSPDITLKGITNNCAAQQTVTVTFGDAGKLGRYYFGNDIAASADKYIAFEDGIINKTLDLTVSDGGIYYLYLYDKSDNFNYTTYTFYKTEFDGERAANENTATVVTYSGNSITFSDAIKNISRAGYSYNGWFENETYSGTVYYDSYTPVKNTVLHAGWTPNVVLFNENKSVDDSRVIENIIAPTWKSSFDGLTVTRDSSETIKVSGTQTSDVTLFTSPFDPDAGTNYRITVESCGGTVAGDGYLVVEFTTTSGEVLGEDIKYIYDYSTGANGSAVFSFNSEQAGKIGGIRVWLCGGSGNTFSDYQFRVKLDKASAGDAYAYSKNAAHIVAPASVYASLPTPERTGYTFDGWSTVVDGEAISNTFNFGAVVGTQTFYAKWKANTYTVVYKGGSANYINFEAGNEPKQTCTYDTDFYLLAEEAVKDYYERKFNVSFDPDCENATVEGGKGPIEVKSTFAGWKDENTGKVYTAELEIKELQKNLTSVNGGIIELVAQWKDTEITLPTADRPIGDNGEKYNLQGWFESRADNAKRLGGAGTKYTVSANITFYAKWTPVDIKDKNIAYDFAEKTTFSVIDVNGYDIIPANLKEAKVSIGSGLKDPSLIHMPTANSNINEGFSGSYSIQFLDSGSTNLTFSIPDGEDDENYSNFKNALTQQSTVLFLSGSDSFTGTASFYFEFAFIEEGEKESEWQYITGQVNIVPANSVYYEETVFAVNDTVSGENYGTEWAAEGAKSLDSNAGVIEYQAYGYSREYRGSMTYSAGTAIKADVSELRPSSKMSEFKFNGAGFELVSDCGPNTSALMVYVWKYVDGDYRLIANSVVDTRITDENLISDGLLKQVPVYHFLSTERAEYLVQVCAIYVETELSEDVVQGTKSFNELTDELEEIGVKVDEKLLEVKAVNKAEAEEAQAEEIIFNRYAPIDVLKAVTAEQRLLGTGEDTSTGYIDGIRVYKPTEDESSYYSWEKDATFFNILQRTRDEAGALTEYQVDGQNDMIDEIYLAPKNGENISSTAFSIDGFESGKNRIMVSLRAANGETEVYVSGGEGSTGKIVITLDHSTEMYYDITDAVVNGTVVISNNGSGYAAVCNLKVTADNGTINVTPLAPQKIEGVRAMLSSVASLSNIAYTPLVEPKPQKEEQGEQGENPPSGSTAAVKIFKFEKSTNSVEVEYRSTVKFYAVEETIPDGAKLCWYLNGKRDYASDGKETLVLTELTEQTTVQAKILGEDDSELAESGKVTVKVKGGFFQKLIAFIRGLFRKLPVYDFKPNK